MRLRVFANKALNHNRKGKFPDEKIIRSSRTEPEDTKKRRDTGKSNEKRWGRSLKRNTLISVRVAKNSVRKMFRSTSFYVLLFFTLVFWYLFGHNIKELAADLGYGVPPYLLPHFFGSGTFRVQGRLLLVLLTCQAPFLSEDRLFTVQRTGRMAWCIGQMLYILLANVIFLAVMLAAQVLTLLPHVSFGSRWGTVIRTAAENTTLLYSYAGYGTVKSAIISGMTPAEAMGKQMLLCILLGTMVGMASFLINGITRKHIAAVIMVGAVLAVDYMGEIDGYLGTSLLRLNPFAWVSLTEYLNGTYDFAVNVWKMAAICAVLMAACIWCTKKGWIRVAE
ncbi:MAG: hypothetical protein LUE29_08430 [Lachnospiraceae bacterium]|nr:hypothetical protein [Lachnospiraceae bacterium]